jgi:hypothetical protein
MARTSTAPRREFKIEGIQRLQNHKAVRLFFNRAFTENP